MEAVHDVDPSRVRGLCQKHRRQTAATTVDLVVVKVKSSSAKKNGCLTL